MKNFYVTYGFGTNLASCYSTVRAVDYPEARQEVFKATGGKFAFLYDEKDFAGQPEKYSLREVELQPQVAYP